MKVDIDVREVASADQAACSCRVGVVRGLTLVFLDRECPPKNVLMGLEATINTLLAGIYLWEGRSIAVNWFNTLEHVSCREVVWAVEGSCCAASVGVVAETTVVKLAFGLDGSQKTTVITGLPGSGKTLLAKVVGDVIGVPCRHLNAADIFQTYVGHSEATLAKVFEDLARQTPSLLIIDGLEAIATTRHGLADAESSLEVGVLGTLIASLDRLRLSGTRAFVIGTTSRFEDLDSAVYSNGRMETIVRLEPPSQPERFAILRVMTKGWPLDETDGGLLERLSDATGGYVGADLLSVCQKALQASINDVDTANNVAGNAKAKLHYRHFEKAMATTFPSVLQAHHMSLRQQQDVDASLPNLLTKVVGDTEKALRELFHTARSAAPCVLFFDQIESIAPVRGFDTSTEQTFDRLLSMLLVEMDGFSTSRQSLEDSMTSAEAHNAFLRQHVVILASTTHKHHLDPAILRPGRFDVHIELRLPDYRARVQLVLDCLEKIPIDFTAASDPQLTSADGLAAFITANTEGFTAADLSSLFREAAMATMRSNFHASAVAVSELTKTLLAHDFGIEWTMPIDRLCPPLPNRLNYLHWIEDLLQRAGVDPFDKSDGDAVFGIDIGTGASCIYALLGAKMNGWRFLATEIDETSFVSAQDNVARNNLEKLISVQRVRTTDLLQEPLQTVDSDQSFHFSMCNPPFFDDLNEADTNPDVCCMGASHEMVFPGGEVGFISHMINDSMIMDVGHFVK
ncbi:hypothetical protein ATCC90586_002134 [Pythium insidiosum]|nr:hypothetical protein ATCC90586_002134 [Pythium insidiosum]